MHITAFRLVYAVTAVYFFSNADCIKTFGKTMVTSLCGFQQPILAGRLVPKARGLGISREATVESP